MCEPDITCETNVGVDQLTGRTKGLHVSNVQNNPRCPLSTFASLNMHDRPLLPEGAGEKKQHGEEWMQIGSFFNAGIAIHKSPRLIATTVFVSLTRYVLKGRR